MSWWEYLKEALKGLAGHKVRAFLSALGILFGVGSVVAVVSVSAGAREQILRQLRAMGASNVMVRSLRSSGDLEKWKRARARTGGGLTIREADYFASRCDMVETHCPVKRLSARAKYGDVSVGGEVLAVRPEFMDTSGFVLSSGRFLTAEDERLVRRVCVVEEEVAAAAFGPGGALSQRVWIDAEPYEIVGVLEAKEVSERKYEVTDIAALNRRIYVPLRTGLARTTRDRLSGEVDEVVFRARRGVDPRRLADAVGRFYESAHGTAGVSPEERDYEVMVTLDLVRQAQETQRVFSIVLAAGAGISLLVGGIRGRDPPGDGSDSVGHPLAVPDGSAVRVPGRRPAGPCPGRGPERGYQLLGGVGDRHFSLGAGGESGRGHTRRRGLRHLPRVEGRTAGSDRGPSV
jgi:putative ABC transport system permease protein